MNGRTRLALVASATIVLSLATPATAARFEMRLQPAEGQTHRMQEGVGTIDNDGQYASIRLFQAEEPVNRRGSIGLMVLNRRTTPFNFGPENVTARLADGTSVPIISYDQLVSEERRRQGRRRFAAILGAAARGMSAANAGYSSGTATYSGSNWGTFGGTPYSGNTFGTATVSTYNPAAQANAQAIANAQNREVAENMNARHAAAMEGLRENLRITTVDPGQVFGGSVMFELPAAVRNSRANVPVTFIVTIDGEVHQVQTVLVRQ